MRIRDNSRQSHGVKTGHRRKKTFQILSVVKSQTLEVLEHRTPTQIRCYDSVSGALQHGFGRRRQTEVFWVQLKNKRMGKDETLPLLVQDMEALVRDAYPMALEDTVDMLAKDWFVDTLQDRQLKIHVKQAAPKNVQEDLARTAEFEVFLRSCGLDPSLHNDETAERVVRTGSGPGGRRQVVGRSSLAESRALCLSKVHV